MKYIAAHDEQQLKGLTKDTIIIFKKSQQYAEKRLQDILITKQSHKVNILTNTKQFIETDELLMNGCPACNSGLVNGYEMFDGFIHWHCNSCRLQWLQRAH